MVCKEFNQAALLIQFYAGTSHTHTMKSEHGPHIVCTSKATFSTEGARNSTETLQVTALMMSSS